MSVVAKKETSQKWNARRTRIKMLAAEETLDSTTGEVHDPDLEKEGCADNSGFTKRLRVWSWVTGTGDERQRREGSWHEMG